MTAVGWQLVTLVFQKPYIGNTSIAIDNKSTPYVVFVEEQTTGKATAMKYNGSSWVYVGNSDGFSSGEATFTCIAIDSSGIPYVLYGDYANGYKATVMKYVSGVGMNDPENRDENRALRIYPNPVKSLLVVSCSLLGKEYSKISIYNMLGKKVDEIDDVPNQKNKIDYDASWLKNGVYIVKITNENNVSVAKFIKE